MIEPCELVLSSGHVVLLDPEDFAWASRWKWGPHGSTLKRTGKVYAWRSSSVAGGGRQRFFLHRVIAQAPPRQIVDHINGDTLDCRRSNLRLAGARGNAQNIQSSKRQKRGQFKGIYLIKRTGKWGAVIGAGPVKANGRASLLHLGCFVTPEEAARAYDRAALERFGEFAALNFPGRRSA